MLNPTMVPEIEINKTSIFHRSIRKDYNNFNILESSSIEFKDFFQEYMLSNIPCIVKNISSNWECVKNWIKDEKINYSYLCSKYGHLHAPVADCNNVIYNSHCKSDMKVSEYLDYLKNPKKDNILYLKDWHLRRLLPHDNFYEVPLLFSSDWLNEFAQDHQEDDYMFVYIGPKDSWTPLHADVYCSYSWSINITGKKKWILFPPGEEKKLLDSLGNLPMVFDHEKHHDVKYFEVVQENGDGIFVPSGWYHQVANILDTISINHNWINGCNVEYVWEALQNNLLSVEHEIEDLKDTEEYPIKCQLILKSVFGMDFKMFVNFLFYIGKKRLEQLKSKTIKGFGNCYYGIKLITFDLMTVINLVDKIINHPLFVNKDLISCEVKNDIIILKNSISQKLNTHPPKATDL